MESEVPTPPPNMPIVKDHEERPHFICGRRQTSVPGLSVPPKILLVDDDAVYRNLSLK